MATRKRSLVLETVSAPTVVAGISLTDGARSASSPNEGGTISGEKMSEDGICQNVLSTQAQREEGLASLAGAYEVGGSKALNDYLIQLSRFHRYRRGDCRDRRDAYLIASQRHDATFVAGFQAWNLMDRNDVDREKGIMIVAPLWRLETDGKRSGHLPCLKFMYAFDIDRTEGKALPQTTVTAGDPGAYLGRLKTLIVEEGNELFCRAESGGEFSRSPNNNNDNTEILSGLEPAQEFSVLVHTLAKELLHHDPVRYPVRCASVNTAVRETEAGAVAYVVCEAIGLDTGIQHSDYIQPYSGDMDSLVASMEGVRRIASQILNAIEAGRTDAKSDDPR